MNLRVVALVEKFWRVPLLDHLLVLEAVLWLAIACLAIAALPFREVGKLAALPIRRQEPTSQARATAVRRIRWAIGVGARRVPWRAMCFEQGLVAQFMLRRRGVPSVLYYGAAPDDRKELSAHVWVRDGNVDVVGCENASRFAVLATFPAAGEAPPCKQPHPER